MDNKKSCRIKYELKEVSLFNEDDWDIMIAFMIDEMIRMERTFKEPLKKTNQKLKIKSD